MAGGFRAVLTGGPDDGKICFFQDIVEEVYTVVKPSDNTKFSLDEVYVTPIQENVYRLLIQMENVAIFKFEGIKD